ncbi:MAG: undecaprenyl/decaprenyl-phosphate alpha-N-acetylglucosaminyl 1-phosphate transferase [Chlorobium sp.]|nr:MAG: undecaprenyl/decaprenyl-phosphate alpha-N-acetylglucosaminyl 1-phosphate transferase [Chlorobium sp.]
MLSPKLLIPVPVFAAVSCYLGYSHCNESLHQSTIPAVVSSSVFPFMEYSKVYFISLVFSFVTILLLQPYAEKLGLIDRPDGVRKIHLHDKPVIGGLGIVCGVLASIVLLLPFSPLAGFFMGILMIAVVGFFDDLYGVNFKIRFAVQAMSIVSIMYFGGTVLHSFGNIFGIGSLQTGFLAPVVTIFCVVGVINAMNMVDGLDGLAGSVSIVAFIAFGIFAGLNGQNELVYLSIAFIGAIAAFLRFNWYPSKLFMGDTGSMTLGFSLAFFAIQTTQGSAVVSPSAALLVLSLPVSDTIVVMIKRLMNGKHPFHADKTHLHHILKDLGLSHKAAVIIMASASAVSSSIAIIGTMLHLPDYFFFTIYCCCLTAYFIASYKLKIIYRLILQLRRNFPSFGPGRISS